MLLLWFVLFQVYIGLFPDAGMTQAFATLKPKGFGLYLGLTGTRLRAADLIQTGAAAAADDDDDDDDNDDDDCIDAAVAIVVFVPAVAASPAAAA